ncbi:Eco57I restriction-modification methylase domain-containing protein [Helcococcus kunzii]|uniref:Eco57I restriction-modification methylase domain-containing protein n=3 Tax=Helcococcus kunzii TaxID=40091 RepID=UPI0038A9531F
MPREQIFSYTDIDEDELLQSNEKILSTLLFDYSTGRNIKWATDNYSQSGINFEKENEIKQHLITGWYNGLIRPRAEKDTEIKIERTKNKAEVFTPSWIVKKQVDAILDELKDISTLEFVATKWLEITCGEAPYMANRYDMISGHVIPLNDRAGFIDKKFQLINKEIKEKKKWIDAAYLIYKSSYGYEYQGDSLLLARENLLLTFIDNYFYMFGEFPTSRQLLEITEIISTNVIQMDGLTYEVPYSNTGHKPTQISMFGQESEEKKEPTLAKIKLWDQDRILDFKDIAERSEREMKFDVVIGNPPYQEQETRRNRNDALYHIFMEEAYKISPRVLLITPARFLYNIGSTPQYWNKKMLNDEHLKVVFFDQNSTKIFPNTDIKGGVAITYRDLDKNFGAIKTFTPFIELSSILKKVEDKEPKENLGFGSLMYVQNKLNLNTIEKYDKNLLKKLGSNGKERRLVSSIFDTLSELFHDVEKDKDLFIKIIGRQNNVRTFKWARKEFIEDNGNLYKYKVILPAANGSGAIGEVLSTPLIGEPLIGEPLIGYTQTFISLGAFNSLQEAKNCMKYIKGKFSRVMLGIKKVTQNNKTKETWSKVPLQDFTDLSDIDWSKSIPEIDQQLYKKYSLDQKEIDFIETNVKEME